MSDLERKNLPSLNDSDIVTRRSSNRSMMKGLALAGTLSLGMMVGCGSSEECDTDLGSTDTATEYDADTGDTGQYYSDSDAGTTDPC